MANVKVRAYASSANLGPGFDVLAVALDAFHDEVEVRLARPGSGRVRVRLAGPYASAVAGTANTAGRVAELMLGIYRESVKVPDFDVELLVSKGVPVGLGLGSSGASAAAAAKALNEALDLGLSADKLIELAGLGEAASAGTPHFDNVAASLLGNLAIVYSVEPVKAVSYRVDATFVLAVPRIRTVAGKTGIMRRVIPRRVPLESVVANAAGLAALVAGLLTGDRKLAGEGMRDRIVEPARAPYVPCYAEVKERASELGALGVALSGAGPSVVILVEEETAKAVAEAVRRVYLNACGLEAWVLVTRPAPGARRVSTAS